MEQLVRRMELDVSPLHCGGTSKSDFDKSFFTIDILFNKLIMRTLLMVIIGVRFLNFYRSESCLHRIVLYFEDNVFRVIV